ncbi:hypothetical protein AVEN_203150-1 [Araneus ventricosus]|uniref:Uncharacterized protein n=1 Tax=Araneus ventricosus TaxID=182803 RepID=A0A4Y2CIJ2_ARAVE|nr:hypothetical protein AVEN_203150-1 [Araneus ventricosus]
MESRFPAMLVLWLGREFYRRKYGSKSLIMTVTALSIALSSPAIQHCKRNSKVVPVDQHYSSVIQVHVFYSLRHITWNHLVHSSISPLVIEISRKGSHFLEFSICRQRRQVPKMVAKVRSPGLPAVSHPILTPVKLSTQT